MKKLSRRSLRKYLLVALLLATPAAMAADREHVQRVGENLMCICGCNQILSGCNHLGCPSSQPMMAEVARYIDQGMTDAQVLDTFVEKYGVKVLSAPPTTGVFNMSAWIMPFLALAAGALAIVYFLRTWKTTTPQAAPAAPPDSRFQRQIEEELEKFTPED